MKSIVYVCPVINKPTGGIKLIYKQAEILSKFLPKGYECRIFHFNDVNFKCDWFTHNVLFKREKNYNPKNEFVIIPEWMAVYHAKILRDLKVRYGIYVLNGFYIFTRPSNEYTDQDIYNAYKSAEFILSCADEISEGIKVTFPEFAKKIMRINLSVDSNKFYCDRKIFEKKSNLITYMPRKKKTTSDILTFLLNRHLPKNWTLKTLDNLSETEVSNIFKKSKIFLSFSELEGLGLPPIEAALCGNYVIGYTGEGGKEFWSKPIFDEVQAGDIRLFLKKIISKVNLLEHSNDNFENINFQIKSLSEKYSIEKEEKSIKLLSDLVNNF